MTRRDIKLRKQRQPVRLFEFGCSSGSLMKPRISTLSDQNRILSSNNTKHSNEGYFRFWLTLVTSEWEALHVQVEDLRTKEVQLSNRIDTFEQNLLLDASSDPCSLSSNSVAPAVNRREKKPTPGMQNIVSSVEPEKKGFLSDFDHWFTIGKEASDGAGESDAAREASDGQPDLSTECKPSVTAPSVQSAQLPVAHGETITGTSSTQSKKGGTAVPQNQLEGNKSSKATALQTRLSQVRAQWKEWNSKRRLLAVQFACAVLKVERFKVNSEWTPKADVERTFPRYRCPSGSSGRWRRMQSAWA